MIGTYNDSVYINTTCIQMIVWTNDVTLIKRGTNTTSKDSGRNACMR